MCEPAQLEPSWESGFDAGREDLRRELDREAYTYYAERLREAEVARERAAGQVELLSQKAEYLGKEVGAITAERDAAQRERTAAEHEAKASKQKAAELEDQLTQRSKPVSSVKKGQAGQETVLGILRGLVLPAISGDATVEDVSKQAHAGDLHVHFDNRSFLVEVKDRQAISKAEIDKFKADMDAGPRDGGIFVTLDAQHRSAG